MGAAACNCSNGPQQPGDALAVGARPASSSSKHRHHHHHEAPRDEVEGTSEKIPRSPGRSPRSKNKAVKPGQEFTREELTAAFEAVDLDRSDAIDVKEMASLIECIGVHYSHKSLHLLFELIDTNRDGKVAKEEFITYFQGKDRTKGVKEIVKDLIQGLTDDKGRVFDKDVYILHAMSSDLVGLRRSWWLSQVLEFADLSCTGPYISRNRDGTKREDIDERPIELSQCGCVALLLEANSLVTEKIISELNRAKAAGKSICTFYEAEQDAWERLKAWRKVCPHAFDNHHAISRHFLSNSEQVVLDTIHENFGYEASHLNNIRPPGGDFDDFSCMRLDGVKWLKPEYAFTLKRGMDYNDLPDAAFEQPDLIRTCFVSYVQEDPNIRGLSENQLQQFRAAVKRNMLGNRVFFFTDISLGGKSFFADFQLFDILSLSRFIILDEMNPNAADPLPFLQRGHNFLEVLMAVLTGCLAPHRDHQFEELDRALGSAVGAGTNIRMYIREGAGHPYQLVNRLCTVMRTRRFASRLECISAERLLRQALERHPLIAQALAQISEEQDTSFPAVRG